MADFKKVFKDYKTIHINFDCEKTLPLTNIKSMFAMIARDINISCKINSEYSIDINENILNIVFINQKEKYQEYINYSTITVGLPQNVFYIMIVSDDNEQEVSYLNKVDFSITAPYVSKVIKDKFLDAMVTKSKRILNYQDQIMVEHLIDEGRSSDAGEIIKRILKRGVEDSVTTCLQARVNEGLGQHDLAFKLLHQAIEKEETNYYILKEMFVLLNRTEMYDRAMEILIRMMNQFQIEEELLRITVGNSIKNGSHDDIHFILDYALKQSPGYVRSIGRFIEVTLFIYMKHTIQTNNLMHTSTYFRSFLKHVKSDASMTKITDVILEKDNKSARYALDCLKESDDYFKYFNAVDLLMNTDKFSQAQIIHRAKELIDFENIKMNLIFKLLIKALEDVGGTQELNKYKNKYKSFFGDI